MLFKEYVESFSEDDTFRGDLVRDILRDKNFPDSQDYVDLADYGIRKMSRNEDILDEFLVLLHEFRVSTR